MNLSATQRETGELYFAIWWKGNEFDFWPQNIVCARHCAETSAPKGAAIFGLNSLWHLCSVLTGT